MSDRILALFAFLVLCGFLGILLWEVPRLDLTILVAGSLALAAFDLFFYKGRDDRG
ncbi:MAG: hypothetical protein ACK4N1_00950 [Pseudorhizobium sp.]